MGEDVIGGRASLVAGDGTRRNFHRSARALSAARSQAGLLIPRYDTAGHSLTSGLAVSLLPEIMPIQPGVSQLPLALDVTRSGTLLLA
jgi:hypothetical protein